MTLVLCGIQGVNEGVVRDIIKKADIRAVKTFHVKESRFYPE